jgi:hypothetical protein
LGREKHLHTQEGNKQTMQKGSARCMMRDGMEGDNYCGAAQLAKGGIAGIEMQAGN